MTNNLTLVSGFITGVNQNKSLDRYIRYGKILMGINIPKIIFIDERLIDKFEPNELTTIIPFKIEDMYYYQFLDKLKTNVRLNTDNPNKDTVEYMMVQCYKTEWVSRAIQLDTYKTEQYLWIDFGIFHLFDNEKYSIDKFYDMIYPIQEYKSQCVRIPYIRFDLFDRLNSLTTICWYFAGGVFGGHKDSLQTFARLTKDLCLRLITVKNWLMWEVNIWGYIHKSNPDLFDVYYGNHDETILTNYIK